MWQAQILYLIIEFLGFSVQHTEQLRLIKMVKVVVSLSFYAPTPGIHDGARSPQDDPGTSFMRSIQALLRVSPFMSSRPDPTVSQQVLICAGV